MNSDSTDSGPVTTDPSDSAAAEPRPAPPKSQLLAAWLAIGVAVAVAIGIHFLPVPEDQDGPALDLLLLRIQSQYMVGVAQFSGDDEAILKQVKALNTGRIAQRQRYIALLGELAGPVAAAEALADLDALIQSEIGAHPEDHPDYPSPQQDVQAVLRELLLQPDGVPLESAETYRHNLEVLGGEQRQLLEEELGWLGRLLQHPEGTDDSVRRELLAPARRVLFLVVGVFGVLAFLGVLGLAALVILIVMAVSGKVQSGLGPVRGNHNLYAETFAVWLFLFLALQLVAGAVGQLLPGVALIISLIGFMASLAALYWPVWRGLSWSDVCHDVGLHRGHQPSLEPLIGVGGYVTALPLLGVGLVSSFVLLLLQAQFAQPESTFAPAGGPAHPIVLQLAESGWGIRIQVLLLAVVAAPIVEETMFRGVLYRHLRELSARFGTALSVLISGTVNSFIFAAIHPQGWVAIPALMALAFAFVLLREWRGTLIPSMMVHGISNGIVMTMMLAVTSA